MQTETLRPAPSLLRHGRSVLGAPLPGMKGRRRRAMARLVMLTCGGLVEVEGAERLRTLSEPALFALNHSNALESVVVPTTLIWLREGRPLHFLVDWMFLHLPLLGWLLRQCEPIPVYTKPARRRWREGHRLERLKTPILDTCLARLAAGGSLGIFPEGTRNQDPRRLLRARGGVGELALRTTVPVVPVGIHYPAAERLGRPPRVGRMVVRIGAPVDLAAERAAAMDLPAGRPRQALARQAAARVMAAIAELTGKTCKPLSSEAS